MALFQWNALMTVFKLLFLKHSLPRVSGQKQKTQLAICNSVRCLPYLHKEGNEAFFKFRECFALDTVNMCKTQLGSFFCLKNFNNKNWKKVRSEAKPTTRGASNLKTSLNCSSHTCRGQHWRISSLLRSQEKKNPSLAIKQTQQLGIYGIGLSDQLTAQKTRYSKWNVSASKPYKSWLVGSTCPNLDSYATGNLQASNYCSAVAKDMNHALETPYFSSNTTDAQPGKHWHYGCLHTAGWTP